MTHAEFLNRIIDDGIEAAKKDYGEHTAKGRGAVAGFEACRGQDMRQLAALLATARTATQRAFQEQAENYWEVRCFEAEVEWVCNCMSAVCMNEGLPPIVPPTARGVLRAAEVLGVRSEA